MSAQRELAGQDRQAAERDALQRVRDVERAYERIRTERVKAWMAARHAGATDTAIAMAAGVTHTTIYNRLGART